jgi:hypothetical protein
MALTSDESRRLEEIDRRLSRDDPRLSRMLSSGKRRCSRLRTCSKWLTLAAFITLIIAVAIGQSVVCLVAWLGLLVGGSVLCGPYLDLSPRPTPPRRS